jgi:psiF repeat
LAPAEKVTLLFGKLVARELTMSGRKLPYRQPAEEPIFTWALVNWDSMEEAMRILLAALISVTLCGAALADTATCSATAKDKKLAGAALKSFMTKCERDAKSKCDADAKAKKLHGAAQTSFTKKCIRDATGA